MSKLTSHDSVKALRRLLGHPASILSTIIGSLTLIVAPGTWSALTGAFYASVGQLFTTVSVGALTLPAVFPPDSPGDWLVLLVGIAFIAKLTENIHDNFQERL